MALKVILSILVVLVVSVTAEDPEKAPLLACDSPTKIKDEYIVVLKEELSDEEVEGHKNMVRTAMKLQGNFSKIVREYSIGNGFRGYHAVADQKMVETLRAMTSVKYIEHDQEMHAYQAECVCQCNAEWGLHRTVFREEDSSKGQYYSYPKDEAGSGVEVFIIDTGIYIDHYEFGDRAYYGKNFIDEHLAPDDDNGHGTHVAGTAIGKTFGLAREADAIAVKVLNAGGSGSNSGVLAGVNWVADVAKKGKSVVNMSLGGGKSTALNEAVNSAVDRGVLFAVAAGNENQDACNVSPASASHAITVASIDIGIKQGTYQRSWFSNYGKCANIFAPGSSIQSAWIGGKDNTDTISGTSMASPHVAGVIAKILSKEDYDYEQMKAKLIFDATKGIVLDDKETDNYLLYHGCGGSCC